MIIKLIKPKTDILKSTIVLSANIDYPKFSLGFFHQMHASKYKFVEIKQAFKNKLKVYTIFNNYDIDINNENDIAHATMKKFKKSFKRDFYKLWEIYYYFPNIIKKNYNVLHLGVPGMETASEYFSKNVGQMIDLLVINTNIKMNYFNNTSMIIDLLTHLQNGLEQLKKEGNLIFKFNELYYITNIKILYIIHTFFKEVFIVKPLVSKIYTSEIFIVCSGFNGKSIDKLISVDKQMTNNIVDIHLGIELPVDFIESIKNFNIKAINEEYKATNNIIKYVNNQNYYGDEYHEQYEQQIKNNKQWIDKFF
jgi:23S rRNA U2552 (ribose-2'-O)-methylase RlmE/FtsJ